MSHLSDEENEDEDEDRWLAAGQLPGLPWSVSDSPNTAAGEVRGVAAFAHAAGTATGWRRVAARIGAWVALLAITAYLIAQIVVVTR